MQAQNTPAGADSEGGRPGVWAPAAWRVLSQPATCGRFTRATPHRAEALGLFKKSKSKNGRQSLSRQASGPDEPVLLSCAPDSCNQIGLGQFLPPSLATANGRTCFNDGRQSTQPLCQSETDYAPFIRHLKLSTQAIRSGADRVACGSVDQVHPRAGKTSAACIGLSAAPPLA